MSIPRMTTTSYAMLGLLAIRPWTTYELVRHMDRSLGRLWPRARSKVYEEPKKLVARGLARADRELVGRRPRTVYTITDEGRRALRSWLSVPATGPVLECEQLLKVFFADHGTTDDLRATLEQTRRWADGQAAEHAAVARGYLAGKGPFQERAAVLALTGGFLADFAEMVGRWAEHALQIVDDWPDDPRAAEPEWSVLERVARRGDEPEAPTAHRSPATPAHCQ